MKKKMALRILIGIIVLIVVAAVIILRPSSWSNSEKTTLVNMTVNGKTIPAEFNSTKTSEEVLQKMPFTISFSPSSVDYCGSLGNLSYEEKDVHAGWANGDIIYMTNGNWFSIFTGGQNSAVPGNVTLGHISEKYLDDVKTWKEQGNVQVTFELADSEEKNESEILTSEQADESEIQFAEGEIQTTEGTEESETQTAKETKESDSMKTIQLTIKDHVLTAKLADNSSAEALAEMLKDGPVTIDMRDYGNMEKVGSFGTTLPTNNEQITTEAGDLILYMGNAFVIYYAPNSWNFTRLGKIQNVTADELKTILGNGDVTVKLELMMKDINS